MSWRRIWIVSLLLLAACERPIFGFRGYTNLSTCQEVINAELRNGSDFEGSYSSDDLEDRGMRSELVGTLFAEPVGIDIGCDDQGGIRRVTYRPAATDPDETAELMSRFATELAAIYGPPVVRYSDINRTITFLCPAPAPIRLEEWILTDESDAAAEPEHSVDLVVVPSAASCLTEANDRDG
jgi:hypothetical protein